MTGKIISASDQSRLTLKPPRRESDLGSLRVYCRTEVRECERTRTDCDTLVSSGCCSFHSHVLMMAAVFHPFVAGVFMMRSAENASHLMAG